MSDSPPGNIYHLSLQPSTWAVPGPGPRLVEAYGAGDLRAGGGGTARGHADLVWKKISFRCAPPL